jgi:hypothetical protein
MVHGLGDIGLHGLVKYGPCDAFFIFLFFSLFWPFITGLYSYFFLFLYITKASPHLTPYHLKGKKGVRRLELPYRLKNYGIYCLKGRYSGLYLLGPYLSHRISILLIESTVCR